MKNKKDATRMEKEGKSATAAKPRRIEPHGVLEELPLKKSPDVDRIVDDIILKYDDFGLTDRG
ncbi:hypothetical protein JW998_07235 [candidate division KSB1 bacterium]|nr:hypothetical protein [candidate division KSB1 bacterium]